MEPDKIVDLEWVAAQAGVPVSFLIGIPVFVTIIFMLSSMLATKEPENYKIGRHGDVKTGSNWLAPMGMLILIGLALTGLFEK